jgi:hypothetical protein
LAEILEKIGDGLCLLDKDRQVMFANEKAVEILKASDGAFEDEIGRAVIERAILRFEHFHRTLNRWFEHQTYPNEDGGITIFSRDVTSRHRLEEALRASEEQFHRLIESNIIGVVVADSEFVTEANDVFLKSLGYTRNELVTRQVRWRDMTPREYDELDAKAHREVEVTGVFSPYEKEFISKSRSRVPVLIGGISTRKEPIETLSLVLDLSERKRAEERVRSIVEGSKILESSLECEKTFAQLAEYIAANLADCCMVFVKEEGELRRIAAAYAVARTVSDEPELNLDHVLNIGQSDVTLKPVSRVLVPILAHDEVAGVLAVISNRPSAFSADDLDLFQELARRAGVVLENARLYSQAQNANRLKDEFVAIVAHELRTPLTPILGGVYMLRTEPRDDKIFTRALNLIERNAKTQATIVDDLLDVSRIISGKLRLNLDPVDLAAVIQAAVETVRPASQAKNIEIELRMATLNGFVLGDADRLQQVVWNLLANSVKFTPSGGRIVVDLKEADAHAEIRVTDTGMGIVADFLPYVFERFRQDTSRTSLHGGLGLGLAIVRHLVDSHGGTVRAESSGDEQGSTFIVRFPLRTIARAAKTSPTV